MIETGKFAREQLKRTDLSPAERKAVESVASQAESWFVRETELAAVPAEARVTASSVIMTEAPAVETPPATPNFYIQRSVEGLVLPSPDQLVESAREELKTCFGKDFEVPQPPAELFETLQNFEERGIREFNETYYLPGLQFKKGDRFWKGRSRVQPEDHFWDRIKDGDFPQVVAILDEGWYIGDRRGKPMYANGQQRYGTDDYMEPLMAYLRDLDSQNGGIERYSRVPDNSRFGASPREIEGVILPEFARLTEAKGVVKNRRYIEFNVRGNMAHPEWGQTDTSEWFGGPVFWGTRRLIGGRSVGGGLARVNYNLVGLRSDRTGFSPEVFFPSKAR